MTTPSQRFPLANLAQALLAGAWSRRAMLRRAREASGADARRLGRVVRNVLAAFGPQPPDADTLTAHLAGDLDVAHGESLRVVRIFWPAPEMTPRWPVPALASTGRLAEWLGVSVPRLLWLADVKGLTGRQGAATLRHYVPRWIARRSGGRRLLEVPKSWLKAIQRRILDEILERIPPHDAAHGFRRGRSVRSYVAPHVGRTIVLRFDVKDFFPSVSAAKIHAIFRSAGFPEQVARLLTGLCTTRTPADVEADPPLAPRWRAPHLPQGAPTSPAMANLAAYRLDVRLAALARSLDAAYTRYADDIAFSGDDRLARAAKRVQVVVAVIAAEEGLALHLRKSRFMRRSVRQQLAGVVVNDKPNVGREAYDLLKATLHNCVRFGPAGQNRDRHADFRGHLAGRIAHVAWMNPNRGAKLQAIFDRIAW